MDSWLRKNKWMYFTHPFIANHLSEALPNDSGDILTWWPPTAQLTSFYRKDHWLSWPVELLSLSLRETLSNPFQPVVSTLLIARSWSVTCDHTTDEIRIQDRPRNTSFCHHCSQRPLLPLQLSGPSHALMSPHWWISQLLEFWNLLLGLRTRPLPEVDGPSSWFSVNTPQKVSDLVWHSSGFGNIL